jgi:Zn-dependent M28 family amino/carboxypeptidase
VLTERFPKAIERAHTGPPLMWGAVGGPLLVALGALLRRPVLRRLGTLVSAGYAAAMADIGARGVVPGANDNATGCAALVAVARALADDPPPDTRVTLLATGSEESFSEGMVAFGQRHFGSLPIESTTFISLDTFGSPHLLALEGEGFLGVFEYPKDLLALVANAARELDIELTPGLRTRANTDGVVPLRAGYPTVSLTSVDRFKQIPHYHLPTDTPEHVQWCQVADAVRLSEAIVRRLTTT